MTSLVLCLEIRMFKELFFAILAAVVLLKQNLGIRWIVIESVYKFFSVFLPYCHDVLPAAHLLHSLLFIHPFGVDLNITLTLSLGLLSNPT